MLVQRVVIVALALTMWTVAVSPLFAMSLDEAKAKGLVGEKASGYLGAVSAPSEEVQALIADVNQKRRRAYQDIARRNGTDIKAVETLAGEKAIQNTKPGNYVESPGGWVRK
jgi:hypothetical protein